MLKPLQNRRWLRIAIMIALAAFLLGAAEAAWACPNCKEGLAQNDPHGQSIAAGYYYSILFMLSMPFIILTTFGTFAYRSVKKAQAQRDAIAKLPGEPLARG
jgi:hypothetical protein